jgi:hypothetical protein
MGCEKLLPPGGWGAGEGGQVCAKEEQDVMPPFPCLATLAMVEASHSTRGISCSLLEHVREGAEKIRSREEPALCKWLWIKLRMKFSAGCLQCRPAEAFRCYEFPSQTQDVFGESFEQRDALSFQNEYSDEL